MNKRIKRKGFMAVTTLVSAIFLMAGKPVKASRTEMPKEGLDQMTAAEILIELPEGYYKDHATVKFQIVGNEEKSPEIKTVKARAGRKGAYVDVTESMSLDISEDCTVYVVATDSAGRNYERSRSFVCFDKIGPTLNAAISGGLLTVKAVDDKSGIKKITVNGYDFLEPLNGELSIRLSQFDAGYEEFVIQAEDYVGNLSEAYKTANPYHKDKDAKSSDSDPAEDLPISVVPTNPGSAVAGVTDHVLTDVYGNVIRLEDLLALGEGDEQSEVILGKEFFTAVTASGKVFYIIIDRYNGGEQVRFLTEVTENDLLNVTSDNSKSLPRNSAATNSGIAVRESALPNNNLAEDYEKTREVSAEELEREEIEEPGAEITQGNPVAEFVKKNSTYVIMGGVALFAIIVGYYFKVVKKKKDSDDDDDEQDDEMNGGEEEEDE